jgi:hypothetical protein
MLFCDFFCFIRSYAIMFSKVHCTYITLGQSLQPGGHVDNFLIPVFCRKLFEDNHPSKSGKHHFFSMIGVSTLFCIFISLTFNFFCVFCLLMLTFSLYSDSFIYLHTFVI